LIITMNSLMFYGVMSCINMFVGHRNIFYRERFDRSYTHTLPFFMTYCTVEIIAEIIGSFGYSMMAIVICGMQVTPGTYWVYLLITFCMFNAGESVGIIVCSLIDSPGISVNLVNVLLTQLINMNGANSLTMPAGLTWLNTISVSWYATASWFRLAFDDETFTCETEDPTCYYHGSEVIELYGFSSHSRTYYVSMTVLCAFCYRFASFFFLAYAATKPHFDLEAF